MAWPLDKILNVTNTCTQVGLLALAVFGYFYTVIPLYGKAVLEEQIAKIQLDIEEKNKTITEKEKKLTDIQNNINKINIILNEKQSENKQLKIKNELTQTKLELTVNHNLQMEKYFCFNVLDSIGGVLDEHYKINDDKKKEVIDSKEKIFNCLIKSQTYLNLDEENRQKLLKNFETNKNINFKKFDENFNFYITTIVKEKKLMREQLISQKEKISKYEKNNPKKYKEDFTKLVLELRKLKLRDIELFNEFSLKSLNDYEI